MDNRSTFSYAEPDQLAQPPRQFKASDGPMATTRGYQLVGICIRTSKYSTMPLGHPWGTLATVRGLLSSPQSRNPQFHWDFETQETPRIVGDSHHRHS